VTQEVKDMVISLTPELSKQLDAVMAAGHYSSAEEALQRAISLLEDEQKLEHLRAVIDRADSQVATGQVKVMTETFWKELKAGATERRARGETPRIDV
jgi:putative addiction module CopG family antidote